MQKVPYMLIVGDKEEQAGTVAIRSREKGEIGVKSIQDFSFDLRPEMRYNS